MGSVEDPAHGDQDNVVDQSLGMSSDALFPSVPAEVSEPQELIGDEESIPEECIMVDVLTRSVDSYDASKIDLFSLRPTDLCSKCDLCKIMKRIRFRRLTDASERAKASRFWGRVDMVANNLYWPTSQVDGDTTYPLIQSLRKDAILDHPYMRRPNSKFRLADYDDPRDIPHISEPSKVLNAIQAEELRLDKALVCTASHYGALSYESKARSKLEALDVMDNICKSLRILWLAEFRCRKAVLDDDRA